MSKDTPIHVRFYRAEDRERIRQICCDTGFLGQPIDPVFQDRELFADYLTAYYTDIEPESSVVLEAEGRVQGYILGSRHPAKQDAFDRRAAPGLFLRGIIRYATVYNAASRRYVRWILSRGWREVPARPEKMAHFHINLLSPYRTVRGTHDLIDFFLDYLHRTGEAAVYGQMVTFEKRRGERMFARYGFEVKDCVEVTKYRHLVPTPVYLFTVVKDLRKNPRLYGTDLWKVGKEDQGTLEGGA
ncbi:MAG: GNAT family acetyltransferase [Candidatus Methylacidiphilales bacterium]|nr:GNAT family acetyltransferase [Candidatus Methylacidiphilales bacterium]